MENRYAQALYQAIAAGCDSKTAIKNLVAILTRTNRRELLPRIAKAFARIAQREGAKNRTVLSVARHQDIPAAIDAAAKFAKVQKSDVHVDKSLIGGWRLEHQDMLVDTSYKQQLLDIFNRVTA